MISDQLTTLYTHHTTQLQRVGATEGNKVLPFLVSIENDVVAILNKYRKRKVTAALQAQIQEEISKVTRQHLQDYTSSLKVENRALGAYEADFAVSALNGLIEDDGFKVVAPTAAAVNARAIITPVKIGINSYTSYSSMMKNYWGKWADEIDGVVQAGFLESKTMPEITNAILGKMDLSKSGATKSTLDRARRSAKQLAITGTNHYANTSRIAFVDKNDTMLKGFRFLAVQDSRTSKQCRSLDQTVWLADDPKLNSVTPALHPRCRSALSYEVDDRFKDDEDSKKPSSFEVDGKRDPKPIDSDGIYYENLKELKESDQDAVLGPTLGEAFRELDNPSQFAKLMLDDNNRPLTIKQLKTRNNALSRILREQSKRD